MTTVFENIYHGLGNELGEFRIIAAGVGWKGASGNKVTFVMHEMKYIQWLRVARNFQLRFIFNNNKPRETFDGFLREDHDKIAHLVKQHWNIALETKEISFKGWNWGAFDVQGSDLAFLVSNKTGFEIPLEKISNSNMAGKNEVSLEFALSHPPPGGKKSREDELVEMRLFIPSTYVRDADGDEDAKMDVDGDTDGALSAAQIFHDMIKDKAEIGQVTGEHIAVFEDVNVTTPRGRFDIDMFKDFLRLRGKMYDYKIFYTAITRLFLLPKPDDVHIAFVVGLDPPIRQGQTRHPYLVMQCSRDDEMEMELQLEEEEIEGTYKGQLQKNYDNPMHEVISSVFRGLSGKKITAPSGHFQSRDSHSSIRTSLKAAQGDLYFLDKALLFLGKPVTFIEFEDVSSVVFSRVGGAMASARTFDLKIVTKEGPETTFSSINKEEHELVETFLKTKKNLRVKNEISDDMLLAGASAAQMLDDDSDDDMEAQSSDDGGKAGAKKVMLNGDSEEEDEDFQASESDAGSPSESDTDSDGGAATASDASGDRDFAKKPKKKTKPAAEDGGEGGEKKKKKVKKAAKEPKDDGNDRPKKKVKTKKDAE